MKISFAILALCFLPFILGAQLRVKANTSKAGCCVIVFEDVNYQGNSRVFCSDEADLTRHGWNDKISSFLSNCEVAVYEDVNGVGEELVAKAKADLRNDCFNAKKSRNGGTVCSGTCNDIISSIYFN